MKIATWNLERPERSSLKNQAITEELEKIDADVLILTETNSIIRPSGYGHSFSSDSFNSDGENRTTIWSKFPVSPPIPTYDSATSICVNVQTLYGGLNVYGTVIGVRGNREKSFIPDLERQILDWKRISQLGHICIVGDFNISWDSYYFTRVGREKLCAAFKELSIKNLTSGVPENIDHIAISNSFLKAMRCEAPVSWNQERKLRKPRLSDHMGLAVKLERLTADKIAAESEDRT